MISLFLHIKGVNAMSKDIQITISEDTAKAILKIDNRYFFDLFQDIRTSENEEYQFRDAIAEVAKQIKSQTQQQKELNK